MTNKIDVQANILLYRKANESTYNNLAFRYKAHANVLIGKINNNYLKKTNGNCPVCQAKMIKRGKNSKGFNCYYCPKCKKFHTGSEGTFF
jgi:ssDNA-binding Zn-finger/Zn-ribbon topoisomerase 1